MHNKIRLIIKGQQGTKTDTINNSQNSLNQQTNFLQFLPQLLINAGVMSGNPAIAGLGQLGTSLYGGVQLAQNWNKLSTTDKQTGVAGLAGQTFDNLDNMFFAKQHMNDSALTKGLNNTYDSISSAAMMFSPVGTLVGGAMKAGKFIGDGLSALGVGTDQLTSTDRFLDSSFMKLSPVGLINGLGAKRIKDFSLNKDTIEKVGGDYAGAVKTMEEAASVAGKKVGALSSTSKFNNLVNKAQTFTNKATGIANTVQDQLANKSDLAYTRYRQDINGSIQPQYLRAAKHGAILQRINLRKHKQGGQIEDKIEVSQWQPTITLEYSEISKFKEGGQIEESNEWQPTISLNIQKLEEGGKTEQPKQESEKVEETNQKNVIPEGALHARKHNMENAEDLTKKGIPVVDNKGEQQAEIEKNEIIFNLEVTKQLEDLHKRYQGYTNTQKEKDELAIEAGKLLVYQIMHNTEDRTGLIKECKKGGTLDESK